MFLKKQQLEISRMTNAQSKKC